MRRNMVAGILNTNTQNNAAGIPSMSNVSNYSQMGGPVTAQPTHFDQNKRKKLREMIFGVKQQP